MDDMTEIYEGLRHHMAHQGHDTIERLRFHMAHPMADIPEAGGVVCDVPIGLLFAAVEELQGLRKSVEMLEDELRGRR